MEEKILYLLKKNENYISGEEISRSLNITRAGIWKHMQELRALGYDIVAVPHLGYKLVSCPDKLLPAEIKFGLKSKILGKEVIYYDTVPSTMDIAFERGLKGAGEGFVVCAEAQSKGRGRLGRHWASPKGKGIYMSVLLRPQLAPSEVARLTLLCAVAVCEAVKQATGLQVSIKWPNDLQIKGKKLAGILTELSAEADRVRFIVVGIGMNVNTTVSSLPPGATSLRHELKRNVSRVELTKLILREIEQYYVLLQKKGFDPVAQKWRELSITLNKRIRVHEPRGFIEGEAVDIDTDGGLLVRSDTGVIIKKMAGDVVQIH